MRNARACAIAILLALVATGCSTVTVSTDYDRRADFASYTTFEMRTAPSVRNPLMRDRIEAALVKELTSKGLSRAAGRPDVWVSTHVRMSNEKQIDTTRLGYGWGRWGYWGGGTAVTTVRKVPVGTLIVDLVDAERKELVWQGVASDAIDPGADAAERDKAVAAMIAKMFRDYPPAAR